MRYAVLGTGMVGHTLATKLASLGHEVRMGARDENNAKAATWVGQTHGDVGQATFAEASRWAERIIVAVNGANIVSVAGSIPADAVAGKVMIDVTNPLDMSKGMPPVLVPELSNTTSAGETLQAALPGALVVKALNTMNHEIMVDPGRVEGQHDVFFCSDHEEAKTAARELLAEFGWTDPVDLGPLAAARGTEGMMPFWLRMWAAKGSANFNYRIVS